MKDLIINQHLQGTLNFLGETGEFSESDLENLSKDPQAMFKACLQWEGIYGYDGQIIEWAKDLFKADPSLLLEEGMKDPRILLKEKEEEISFLVDLLSEEQLDRFIQFTIDREEMNNEKG